MLAGNWCNNLSFSYANLYRLEEPKRPGYIEVVDLLHEIVVGTWREMEKDGLNPKMLFGTQKAYQFIGEPMAMAIYVGLAPYVTTKITNDNYKEYNNGEWLLLMAAVCAKPRQMGNWLITDSDTSIIKHLLECGADPNELRSQPTPSFSRWPDTTPIIPRNITTPWHNFLVKSKTFESLVCLRAFELFVQSGADLTKRFTKSLDGEESCDAWEVLLGLKLSDTGRVQQLKGLMLEKGYKRSLCEEEVAEDNV
jgi:hypothetical protein